MNYVSAFVLEVTVRVGKNAVTTELLLRLRVTGFLDCPLSGILNARKRNVLKTGSVSILKWEVETPIQLGLI
jgi:hypothetical protein